ncbi:MAG: choice-of-anchor D domain-containing protein [Nitrospirota bacterium]|nr:choice-of-anchor D domain-containing protein [Nitrospirota bacterium]
MSRVKIYSVLLALASLFLFTVQPAWAAVGSISPLDAYNNAKARNGVIIDVRSVEEHNKCQPPWAGETCPNPEAGNNGSPQWVDDATGVTVLPPNIPFWISSTASDKNPEDTTEYRNAFQALLDSGYITKSTPLYFICRSGYRSYYGAVWVQNNMGFTNVYTLDSDGLGGTDGGMLEWTKQGLPKNETWKPPQIYSITPVDGFTETSTDTVTFSVGILEPTWGNVKLGRGWQGFRAINSVDLYVAGAQVASDTTDTVAGTLWTVYSFTQTLSNGSHTWNVKATSASWTASTDVSWSAYALDAGPGDRTLTVSTIVSEPNISVSPGAKDFGSVTVGGTSSAQTFTVSNTGTADLNIYAVTKTGDFTITADSCSSATVTAGSNCTVSVVFEPATEGFLTGTLSIPSDDPDTAVLDVALSGTGVAATTPEPNISVTPASLAFGNVVVGDTSAAQTVTIANTGTADLTVTNVAIIGDFTATGSNCPLDGILAPGVSCTADVVFQPAGLGDLTGTLFIESDDPDSAVVNVALSGTGIATPEPDISVSPTTVDFGSVIIGNTSAQTVTVTNAGSATLNVGALAVTGDYSTANDLCSNSAVAVGDNCTVDVIFTPSAEGVNTGTLSIPSDDPDTAVVDVALSGTGVAAQPDITVSTTSVDFDSVTVGDSDSQVVTVTNDGTADLTIASVSSLSDPFSITDDGCTGTLAPSESCAITVSFAPSAVGTFTDSLVITSDDPDEASVTVSVSGEGVEVGANQPPTKPELLYPENGATDVPTSDLPLVWKKATDPDNDPVTYEVTYCKDENLTDGCVTVSVDDTTASAKGTDSPMFAGLGAGAGLLLFGFVLAGSTRRRKMVLLIGMMILTAMFLVSCGDDVTPENTTGTVISGLDANTTYYWQVTASDGQDQTLSDEWSFKTESGKKRRGRR